MSSVFLEIKSSYYVDWQSAYPMGYSWEDKSDIKVSLIPKKLWVAFLYQAALKYTPAHCGETKLSRTRIDGRKDSVCDW